MSDNFKICSCGIGWTTANDFLSDKSISIIGYQVDFEILEEGLFLFNHTCKTTLALQTGLFQHLYDGPVYTEVKTGSKECPTYCLYKENIESCPAKCACGYIRAIMQKIKNWQKT